MKGTGTDVLKILSILDMFGKSNKLSDRAYMNVRKTVH